MSSGGDPLPNLLPVNSNYLPGKTNSRGIWNHPSAKGGLWHCAANASEVCDFTLTEKLIAARTRQSHLRRDSEAVRTGVKLEWGHCIGNTYMRVFGAKPQFRQTLKYKQRRKRTFIHFYSSTSLSYPHLHNNLQRTFNFVDESVSSVNF